MHRLRRHGWIAYHCPESRVVHIAGASTGVVDGKQAGRRSPPDYIFQSRHRYFALTGGRRCVLIADLAWLLGNSFSRLLRVVLPKKFAQDDRAERRTLFRIGLGADAKAAQPSITYPSDVPGMPPVWMRQ
jgi:GT2 family glycosyltransferase